MAQVAFELRESFKGGDEAFSGGSVSLPDGKSLDIAEALSEGDGVIVLEPEPSFSEELSEQERHEEYQRAWRHERIAAALDSYPALKRVGVPEDAEVLGGEVAGDSAPLESKTIPELLSLGKELDAEVSTSMNKSELIEAVRAKQNEGDDS